MVNYISFDQVAHASFNGLNQVVQARLRLYRGYTPQPITDIATTQLLHETDYIAAAALCSDHVALCSCYMLDYIQGMLLHAL